MPNLPLDLPAYPPELRSEVEAAASAVLAAPPVDPGLPAPALFPDSPNPLSLPPLTTWLIGVSGKPRSGKDVLADYLQANFASVCRMNFSDPIILEANLWLAPHGRKITPENKSDPLHRKLLQVWGRARRFEDENYWVDLLRAELLAARRRYSLVIVAGVRAGSDLTLVEELGGVCVRVERPGNDYRAEDPIESDLDSELGRMIQLINPHEDDLAPYLANIDLFLRQLSV